MCRRSINTRLLTGKRRKKIRNVLFIEINFRKLSECNLKLHPNVEKKCENEKKEIKRLIFTDIGRIREKNDS